MPVRAGKYINIPENSVITESVLILKVAAAAPFAHIHPYGICTRAYKLGNIKLAHKVAALGKSHILTVYINLGNRGNALENQICIKAAVGQLKAALVNAHRVNIGHIGRVAGVRIIYICIIGLFIALCLPAGGHLNSFPFLYITCLIAVFKKGKAPLAVKRAENALPLGNIPAAGFKPVFTGFLRIFINAHNTPRR